jgi:hypothetical protein
MRRFHLHRLEDETGTSGKGIVAEGVVFTDGTCVLRWTSSTPSTVLYEGRDGTSGFEAMLKVHGHEGKTKVIWKDE